MYFVRALSTLLNGLGLMSKSSLGPYPYAGLFKEGSRVNHSCSPNTSRFFNRQTFGIEFRALRSIKKGEEIFTNYGVIDEPTANRQNELAPYGFQCRCQACREPRKSDLLRYTLAANTPRTLTGRQLVVWLMSPGLPESYVVDPCLERLKAIEEAGLELSAWYSKTLGYLFEVYCAMGNASEAFKYLRKHERVEYVKFAKEPRSEVELRAAVSSHNRWNWKTKVQRIMHHFGDHPAGKDDLHSSGVLA